jgi:hypothetical protein
VFLKTSVEVVEEPSSASSGYNKILQFSFCEISVLIYKTIWRYVIVVCNFSEVTPEPAGSTARTKNTLLNSFNQAHLIKMYILWYELPGAITSTFSVTHNRLPGSLLSGPYWHSPVHTYIHISLRLFWTFWSPSNKRLIHSQLDTSFQGKIFPFFGLYLFSTFSIWVLS